MGALFLFAIWAIVGCGCRLGFMLCGGLQVGCADWLLGAEAAACVSGPFFRARVGLGDRLSQSSPLDARSWTDLRA